MATHNRHTNAPTRRQWLLLKNVLSVDFPPGCGGTEKCKIWSTGSEITMLPSPKIEELDVMD